MESVSLFCEIEYFLKQNGDQERQKCPFMNTLEHSAAQKKLRLQQHHLSKTYRPPITHGAVL